MIKRGLFALLIQIFFCFQLVAEENVNEFEFSQAELDQILAPIALYPDTILSHILIASTYPLEVIQAHRWAQNNEDLSPEEVSKAIADRDWDPSVKALAPFPNILKQMSEDLDWMQKLGDAFLQNEELVLASIQDLRQRAHEEGNLGEMEHLTVKHEDEHIIIEPSSPEIVYVPYYDTRVVYGSWWWVDYPPVVWVHHHHHYSHYGPWLYWGPRVYVGSGFYFSSFHWSNRHVVVINHNHYRSHRYPGHYVSHHRDARRWEHNTRHRRGVEYRHPRISERHNVNVRQARTSTQVSSRLRESNYSRHGNNDRTAASSQRYDRRNVWNTNSRQQQSDRSDDRQPRTHSNQANSREQALRQNREQQANNTRTQNREQNQHIKRATPPKKVFSHDQQNQRYSRQQESRSETTNRYDRSQVYRSNNSDNASSRSNGSSTRSSQSTRRYNSGSSSSRDRSSSAARNSRHQR